MIEPEGRKGDRDVTPVAAVGNCCDRRCGNGDGERGGSTLLGNGGRRRCPGRRRARRSHPRLSPLDRLHPAPGGRPPPPAAGPGGAGRGPPPPQPGRFPPSSRVGTRASHGGPPTP